MDFHPKCWYKFIALNNSQLTFLLYCSKYFSVVFSGIVHILQDTTKPTIMDLINYTINSYQVIFYEL